MKRQQHNNTQTNFAFKILYGLCLCLTVLALSDQLKLYEQKKAVSAANISLVTPAKSNGLRLPSMMGLTLPTQKNCLMV